MICHVQYGSANHVNNFIVKLVSSIPKDNWDWSNMAVCSSFVARARVDQFDQDHG